MTLDGSNDVTCLGNAVPAREEQPTVALLRALYSNIGDLAIYKGTMNVFSQLQIESKYIFDPEPTFPEGYLDAYNLNLVYTFPSFIEKEIQRNEKSLFNYVRPVLHLPSDLLCMLKLRKEIDCLYCLGGARFGDTFAIHVIGEIINTCYKKRILNADLVIGGISIASSENGYLFKRFYQRFLNQITHLFVRDNISYSNLQKYDIPPEKCSVICDFAYWLDPLRSQRSMEIVEKLDEFSRGVPLIGIAPGMDLKSSKTEYLMSWCRLIRALYDKGYNIVLIPTSHNPKCLAPPHDKDDYGFCHLINLKLKLDLPIIQTKQLEPEEIIEIMKEFDCTVSARMHGAIFSTLADVPTICIYNEQKGLGLFNTFFNDSVRLYSLEEFLDYNKTHLSLIRDLEELLDVKSPYSETIKNMREASSKRIYDVFADLGLMQQSEKTL